MLSWWGKAVYAFARGNLWFWAKLLFRFRVEGASNIPRKGPLLIASNHVSHLDPPLVGLAVPRTVFHMAKKELFVVKPLMWFMRTIGTIMVDRGQGSQALEDALRYFEKGECIIIFPEGTRSPNGILGKGRSGAIVIAIRADCPITPAVIIGSEKAMTKGSKLIKLVPVLVRFGKTYKIEYEGDRDNIPRDLIRKETFVLMQKIEALLPGHMRPSPEQKRAWYKDMLPDQH
jgi:1-acyl-sn-glycerol-3-phosphate acyltransferase